MSTNLISAMTAALLAVACMTALADAAKQPNVSEPSAAQALTVSAPLAEVEEGDSGYIQAVGRSASHSMHPKAPVPAEQLADDEGGVLRQTAEE